MTDKPNETWGKYIRRKRFELAAKRGEKVTQPDLAKMLEKSAQSIYCWERRGQVPPTAEQANIRKILGA